MKRLPYVLMTIFSVILSVCVLNLLPGLGLVPFIIVSIIMTIASAYRLRNIGWMAGYAWIYLIPIFNIPLIYYCCHLPMNYVIDGKVDSAGKIIRTIFLITFLSPVAYILAAFIVGIMQS